MGVRHTSLHVLADERHSLLHRFHSESLCHRRGQVNSLFFVLTIFELTFVFASAMTKKVAFRRFHNCQCGPQGRLRTVYLKV